MRIVIEGSIRRSGKPKNFILYGEMALGHQWTFVIIEDFDENLLILIVNKVFEDIPESEKIIQKKGVIKSLIIIMFCSVYSNC